MSRVRQIIAAIEPWYDWGVAGIDRVDGLNSGDGRWFSIDFLGLHVTVLFGRTPPIRKES